MSDLYKEKGERFFAAANTKDGFISYFDSIFERDMCDKVYILKGGPGVGKSTFMKKLGRLSEKEGYTCEYFLCSSDPDSLDGIIIKEKRTAVIDGTSPHAVEPRLAGAREIIVDLGRAWDTQGLSRNIEKITELSQKKSRLYDDCYRYLYCKNTMDDIIYNLVFPYIQSDKLRKSADRLAKSILGNTQSIDGAKAGVRITNAISTKGNVRLSTFEDMASFCVFIKEPFEGCRIASFFMHRLYSYALNNGKKVYVSYSPVNPDLIDALYFPDARVSISVYDEKILSVCDRLLKKSRIINGARFINLKAFSHLKPLRRFYSRISSGICQNALECLKEAGLVHSELEKIYGSYTSYDTVEKISSEYFGMIL